MKTCRKMTNDDREWRKLNRALQRFYCRTDIQSKLATLFPNSAESEKEGDKITTKLDSDLTGRIPGFIHEILHWYYERETADVPYAIHEGWIASTERSLCEFLQKDKRRMNWWRAACAEQYGKKR